VVTYTEYATFRFFTEEKKARAIRAMFQSYVSPRIVDQLIQDPDQVKLHGAQCEMSILFSDIRGFTKFCETHDPSVVVDQLNEYLTAMTDIVFEWEGTLDKFIGDAVMVYWGAPVKQEDHAIRAVGCALQMRDRLKKLQQKWGLEGKYPLDNGIGINTGEVIVGNIGAEAKKMDYTVIGDAVNLGSRLESLTRKYDFAIIVSEFTYRQFTDQVAAKVGNAEQLEKLKKAVFHQIEEVSVKGKEQRIMIYGVTGGSI
jgi:adenylate cyclase